uniref:Secreted protein n=1 Tax=Haemonchus placei TaxID=6290 RepID=A0A0N4VT07_HAEPC
MLRLVIDAFAVETLIQRRSRCRVTKAPVACKSSGVVTAAYLPCCMNSMRQRQSGLSVRVTAPVSPRLYRPLADSWCATSDGTWRHRSMSTRFLAVAVNAMKRSKFVGELSCYILITRTADFFCGMKC